MLCQECQEKPNCTKICQPLENYLNRKQKGRLYSDRWIRYREVPYCDLNLVAEKALFKRTGGKK